MNQDFTINFGNSLCNSCGEEDPPFLHNIWLGDRVRLLCTPCVLRIYKRSFCPTCFGVYNHSLPENTVICYKCHSYSHALCFPNCFSSRASSMCSSCRNPNKQIFALRKLGRHLAIDMNAAKLLVTAAKIESLSMSKGTEAKSSLAEMKAKEATIVKKEAIDAANYVIELQEKEKNIHDVGAGNNNDMALPVDTCIDSKGDSSHETMKDSGTLERFTVEGVVPQPQTSRLVFDFDLNVEYPSWNDAM